MKTKRRQEKTGLDALAICFKVDDNVFNRIYEGDVIQWWGEDGSNDFFTYKLDEESDDRVQLITLNIPDGDVNHKLGTMRICHSKVKNYGNKAFLAVENKSLYKPDLMSLLPFITGIMGLQFNNITKLDIALNSTYNYGRAIMNAVRGHEKYDMIYNGRTIKNPLETIKGFTKQVGVSRAKDLKNPTLYFGHKKSNGIHVCVYDKAREMMEQTPEKQEYIYDWFGTETDKLHRIEVSLNNPEIRELCSHATTERFAEWSHDGNLLNLVTLPAFLEYAFERSLDNVLYFRKDRNTKISVWDL